MNENLQMNFKAESRTQRMHAQINEKYFILTHTHTQTGGALSLTYKHPKLSNQIKGIRGTKFSVPQFCILLFIWHTLHSMTTSSKPFLNLLLIGDLRVASNLWRVKYRFVQKKPTKNKTMPNQKQNKNKNDFEMKAHDESKRWQWR